VGALVLTGCAAPAATSADGGAETSPASGAASAASATPETDGEQRLTVEQPWVKARTDGGMTGVFGTLVNDGDEPVVITGAGAGNAAGSVELHETVLDPETGATVMRQREEPITVAPGESYVLEPGADHIMLLDLECGLYAGDELELTLRFEDGAEQAWTAVIKDYAGAQEEYRPDGGEQGHAKQSSPEQSHGEQGHAEQNQTEQGHSAGATATGMAAAGADLPSCHE
jgi:copper(I)-binding protein